MPGPSVRLRRYLLGLNLRFVDDEWDMVKAFIIRAQSWQSFAWEPHGIAGTPASYTVRLESPRVSEAIRPARDSSYITLLTLPIVLGSDTILDTSYFPVE